MFLWKSINENDICYICEYIYNKGIKDNEGYVSGHLPAQSYNRNTGTRCEICSKLTMKTPELRQWRHSAVFIAIVEQILHLFLVFLLLTLSM